MILNIKEFPVDSSINLNYALLEFEWALKLSDNVISSYIKINIMKVTDSRIK